LKRRFDGYPTSSRRRQSISSFAFGARFDLLNVTKPVSPDAALNLAKVISKLSPLLGNLIEFNAVEFLNAKQEFQGFGEWKRQDPGFPDTVFEGTVHPVPGFEIKTWFPLATEITGRFKDSQNRFVDNNVNVCLPAWLPEHLIYGKPRILDVVVVSAASVAKARDSHYHDPPGYLVVEPEDTTTRTRNLQQTNTRGYKFQATQQQLIEAEKIVESWGTEGRIYRPTREYWEPVRELMAKFQYRPDTNYSKMDRIKHADIEAFKTRVLNTIVNGMTVQQWSKLFRSMKPDKRKSAPVLMANETAFKDALSKHLGIPEITEAKTEKLLV
jgi:hypothetical protein